MAAVVTVLSRSANQKTVDVHGTIVLSGNYATGGEPLPAANLKAGTSKKPHIVIAVGISGFDYCYNVATEKLMVYAAGVEASAAAYPAGVLADTIRFVASFPKFG